MSRATPPRDFGFGPDEEMLRDLARKFLDENLPVEKLRTLVAADHEAVYDKGQRPAWDEGLWKQIVELGWPGLAVPEGAGGVGFKTVGIVALVEEAGRHALPSPLLVTLCSSFVLREAELPAAQHWLGRIAQGAAMSLAITNAEGSWEPGDCGARASQDGDGVRLTGTAHFVQDAFKVGAFLVSAAHGDGHVLCVMPADAEGLSVEQDHIHDLTRDQATLRFDDVRVPADAVVSRAGTATLRRAWPALLVTVSADLCGSSEWQLQTTVEYARNRVQFDHPLGILPGGETPAGRFHAVHRPGAIAALPRGLLHRPGQPRRGDGGAHGEEHRLGRRCLYLGPLGAAPRGHRIHLGMRHPPLLQAQPAQPGALRRRRAPAAQARRKPDRADRGLTGAR